jgi:hypothetical protein
MKSKIRLLFASVVAPAVLITGCRSSDSTGPSSGQTLDLPSLIGEMGIASVGAAGGAAGIGGVGIPTTPPVVPSSCQYSASIQGFTCATFTSNGITLDATFFLLDAAGHFQSQPDAATTAAMRTVTDVKGTTSLDQAGAAGSMTFSNHQDMTLSGLLTDTHVLNGSSTSHSDLTLSAPSSLHGVTDSKTVTANVTMPKSSRWPTSGTITTDATTTSQIGSQSVTGTTRSVLTFTGSSIVTMTTTITVGTSPFSATCKIDLSGASVPVCN